MCNPTLLKARPADEDRAADRPARFERVDGERAFLRVAILDTVGLTAGEIFSMSALLDDRERAAAASIRSVPHRNDFIAAHYLLRRVLEDSVGIACRRWSFGATEMGRPLVARPAM